MFVLRVLGLQSDRWGSPLPVSRKRWIAIGIAIGAIVSIDMPSKMDSAALPTILAGMLGGAVGAAFFSLPSPSSTTPRLPGTRRGSAGDGCPGG